MAAWCSGDIVGRIVCANLVFVLCACCDFYFIQLSSFFNLKILVYVLVKQEHLDFVFVLVFVVVT